MLESKIQKDCMDWLLEKGFLVSRVNSATFKGKYSCSRWRTLDTTEHTTGFPDIIAGKNQITYYIEMKKPDEGLSRPQKRFKRACEQVGIPYKIISSVEDLEEYFIDRL